MLVAAFYMAFVGVMREKRHRLDALREICFALELMKDELSCRSAPFPELFAELIPHLSGAGKSLFQAVDRQLPDLGEQDFAALWAEAVEQSGPSLQRVERGSLDRLGLVLGRYELPVQIRELDACLLFLRNRESEAAGQYPVQRRLGLGLALSSGAILAILLL